MSAALSLRTRDGGSHVSLVERLTAIWSRVLRVSPVGPDSNFFDLGGDSLLAVGLFLEIEQETGIKLPITTIYDASTVAEMAELIAADTAPEFSPLVLLKPGDSGAPLFIVHGIGGTVVELAALGRKIRISEPVYALQAQGIDGALPPLDTIEGMTGLYLDRVRQMQPQGPYWLCGYSFGGLVALEMARRLACEHEEIASLIMMDAYAHPSTWPFVSRVKMRTRRVLLRMGECAQAPLRESAPLLLRNVEMLMARAGDILAPNHRNSGNLRQKSLRNWLLDRNPDLPLSLLRVREAGSAALSAYVPRYYPGNVIFLKAAHRDAEFPDDPQRIWRHLVQDMTVHTVPGSHRSIVTEHAATVAARLTACLAVARQRRARQSIAGTIGIRELAKKTHLEEAHAV
ncbi:MAG: alpha/beta fold hydrolase [Rhizomicrobium sp.]